MTGSSSRLAAAALLLWAAGAVAQVGPPQRLIPLAPPSETAPPVAAVSLLGLRIERLAAMGRLADANELAKLAGGRFDDPALSVTRTDAALLAGDTDTACAEVKTELARRAGPALTKVAAFCAVAQ